MNRLASVAVVLQLVTNIVASVLLIGFFTWCIGAGIAWSAEQIRDFRKKKIHQVA